LAGALGSLTHIWLSVQAWASVVIGLLTIGLALGFAGIVPGFRIPEPDVFAAGGGRLRRAFVHVLRSRHRLKPLAVGLFVGFLPCGLTYYWLIPSLAAGPLCGALLMATFCLGTMPGLLALGLAGGTLAGRLATATIFRKRMTLVAAAMMAILGISFAWRGVMGLV
jgi:sulfite exporter TauE/SafE